MNGNELALLLAAFIGTAILLSIWARLRARRRAEERREVRRREAAAAGLRHEPAGAAPGASPAAAAARPGADVYSGSAGGLAWTAEVDEDLRARNRRSRRARTCITFPSVRAAPGRFVLAMAVPPEVRIPEVGGEGLLANLARRAAEAFLDFYVGAIFGERHRALVNLEGAACPPAPPGLWLLSTDPAVAARLLAPERAAEVQALRGLAPGGVGFGLLATAEGLVYGVPTPIVDPAAVRDVAARLAEVVAKLRW